eukprot:CAMPEP_0181383430 /NCGR_PEP_ID=MMETSP1106-20121128/21347_1 /TAXON_ID=81844 /ORGANISM="Mantoniella antarctica, Strain SL-175" /LENGTH=37 /DNA_ID= /DNA_START= /DNA_END= /DNA_ORIENTATION=
MTRPRVRRHCSASSVASGDSVTSCASVGAPAPAPDPA